MVCPRVYSGLLKLNLTPQFICQMPRRTNRIAALRAAKKAESDRDARVAAEVCQMTKEQQMIELIAARTQTSLDETGLMSDRRVKTILKTIEKEKVDPKNLRDMAVRCRFYTVHIIKAMNKLIDRQPADWKYSIDLYRRAAYLAALQQIIPSDRINVITAIKNLREGTYIPCTCDTPAYIDIKMCVCGSTVYKISRRYSVILGLYGDMSDLIKARPDVNKATPELLDWFIKLDAAYEGALAPINARYRETEETLKATSDMFVAKIYDLCVKLQQYLVHQSFQFAHATGKCSAENVMEPAFIKEAGEFYREIMDAGSETTPEIDGYIRIIKDLHADTQFANETNLGALNAEIMYLNIIISRLPEYRSRIAMCSIMKRLAARADSYAGAFLAMPPEAQRKAIYLEPHDISAITDMTDKLCGAEIPCAKSEVDISQIMLV